MIIDLHRHTWSFYQRYPQASEIASKNPGKLDPVHAQSDPLPLVPDWKEAALDHINELDESGVDATVIFVADYGLRLGEPTFTIEGENRLSAEMGRAYPNRLIPFFGIDPRRDNAVDAFERAVTDWNMKGLKIHTTVGFFPHDRVVYPFYEICVARNLPVTFHSGPMPSPLVSRYAQPLHFDEVAADFPELTIIMGHAGRAAWPEALNIAQMKPNIYLELSTWQAHFDYPEDAIKAIYRMCQTIGVERVLWGSDNPGWRHAMPLKKWVSTIQDLPVTGKKFGCDFTTSDTEAILGKNAARILGIK